MTNLNENDIPEETDARHEPYIGLGHVFVALKLLPGADTAAGLGVRPFCCAGDRCTVTEAASHAGIRIPDEIAVLGVDNDKMICDLSDPPLSSVKLNFELIGYEAAALLEG